MKKKITFLWIAFVVCVAITVGLWFAVNRSNPEFEVVEVEVVSSTSKKVKDRKTGNTYTTYEIKVDYNDTITDLHNAHNSYSYVEGRKVKAYLSNGKLYANEEGVKTSTPIATVYFGFLIGSFVLFFVTLIETSKLSQNKEK
ncbi:MAG: penicillin-binding protein [Bacilli bacterium]|nr:penicillin-binding protein [Bacilli bacterium]